MMLMIHLLEYSPYQTRVAGLKMTTILKLFNAFVPYFMTFSFQVLCIIFEKNSLCRCAYIVPGPYPQLKNQDIGYVAITG